MGNRQDLRTYAQLARPRVRGVTSQLYAVYIEWAHGERKARKVLGSQFIESDGSRLQWVHFAEELGCELDELIVLRSPLDEDRLAARQVEAVIRAAEAARMRIHYIDTRVLA